MRQNRPRISIIPDKTDKLLEVASLALLLAMFVYALTAWSGLPDIIPIHFDAKGQPDGYGARLHIFFSPLLSLVLYTLLTLVNRRPDLFNYPVKITPENAAHHYRLATRLLRLLKLALIMLFGTITWGMVQSAKHGNSDAVLLLIPFTMIVSFLPMAWYFFKIIATNRKSIGIDTKKRPRQYKLF